MSVLQSVLLWSNPTSDLVIRCRVATVPFDLLSSVNVIAAQMKERGEEREREERERERGERERDETRERNSGREIERCDTDKEEKEREKM